MLRAGSPTHVLLTIWAAIDSLENSLFVTRDQGYPFQKQPARMKFFIAGIMQGSHTRMVLHDQDYRRHIKDLIEESFAEAAVYDPLANHSDSVNYDEATGRETFFGHNKMCGEVDVLLAFVPEASMGTAIEMWEAYRHGAAVIAISPLMHNWAVKFLSHRIYADVGDFEAALQRGDIERLVEEVLRAGRKDRTDSTA